MTLPPLPRANSGGPWYHSILWNDVGYGNIIILSYFFDNNSNSVSTRLYSLGIWVCIGGIFASYFSHACKLYDDIKKGNCTTMKNINIDAKCTRLYLSDIRDQLKKLIKIKDIIIYSPNL